jgi:two-component system, LytTR family, response regulator
MSSAIESSMIAPTSVHKVLLVEDDPVQQAVVRNFVERIPELELKAVVACPFEAHELLTTSTIDILLLDIGLPRTSGFELLKQLVSKPQVIILTGDARHALEGFEHGVTDLLVKPYSFERFLRAIYKAMTLHGQQMTAVDTTETHGLKGHLNVRSGRRLLRIPLASIRVAEAVGNYTKLHLEDGIVIANCTMKRMEELIPGTAFTRTHRSYIVANDFVQGYDRDSVYTYTGEIPIGALYRKQVQSIFGNGINASNDV